MKKFFSLIVLAALLIFPLHLEAASNGYGATALTGGTAGCLDAINGAILNDGDKAFVLTATQFYFYTLDADSAAAESSPDIISPDTNAGDKRWLQVNSHSIFGLSSLTQGDLPYASAANTLSALAIGAANYKLFSNAAGNAPEYAVGIKIKSDTYDLTSASGTKSVTGVGFKPSAAILLAIVNAQEYYNVFAFLQNGSIMGIRRQNPAGGPYWSVGTVSLLIGPDNTNYQSILAAGVTMTDDGVDLAMTKVGDPTGTFTMLFMFFR